MIYLVTYSKPHRKTQDLVFRLKCAGIRPHLIVIPWVDRKNHTPLFNTKLPPAPIWPHGLGLPVCDWYKVPDGSTVIVGGAGMLKADFVRENKVVNSHCGWLPAVRGLDALKWAIYYDEPIGCTTHIVNAECDAGLLIERSEIKLESTDNLMSVAMKQYELEINMLVDCVINKKWEVAQPFTEPAQKINRRMRHTQELQMIERLKKRLVDLNE